MTNISHRWDVVRINPSHQDLVDQINILTDALIDLRSDNRLLEERVSELEVLTVNLRDE
jgi:hypothetical protein